MEGSGKGNKGFHSHSRTLRPYSVYADMSPQMILALICLLEQVRILTILRAKASHHDHKEFQYLLRV